jgi:glycosyltransferase involved in cell wall biosynthesis
MPKFSIITPVHLWNEDRVEKFLKCMESLENQTSRDFEWVVVDDGSTTAFDWEGKVLLNKKIPVISLNRTQHNERVVAYNLAFQSARGEWFCLLDSDDEYKPNFLQRLAELIDKFPQNKMFNFGAIYQHQDGKFSFRDPFTPKRKRVGHESFGGGNIVNGTFVFKRSIYEDLGAFPGDDQGMIYEVDTSAINYGGVRDLFMGSPWDFSAAAQLEFPEFQKQYLIDKETEPDKVIREIGNPWGQDFYLFYKYTRKYHSKPVREYFYIVHPR